MGKLPLGLSFYIKNSLSLTSLEGKHLIGCGDKQQLGPPLMFCPWLGASKVSFFISLESAEQGSRSTHAAVIHQYPCSCIQLVCSMPGRLGPRKLKVLLDYHGQHRRSMKRFTGYYQS